MGSPFGRRSRGFRGDRLDEGDAAIRVRVCSRLSWRSTPAARELGPPSPRPAPPPPPTRPRRTCRTQRPICAPRGSPSSPPDLGQRVHGRRASRPRFVPLNPLARIRTATTPPRTRFQERLLRRLRAGGHSLHRLRGVLRRRVGTAWWGFVGRHRPGGGGRPAFRPIISVANAWILLDKPFMPRYRFDASEASESAASSFRRRFRRLERAGQGARVPLSAWNVIARNAADVRSMSCRVASKKARKLVFL